MRTTSIVRRKILGIRREDKNVWERRVPLTPLQIQHLLNNGAADEVLVQPSRSRCYDDAAYESAGARICEDLTSATTIVAVKEIPSELLIPSKTYMFFSHTIKAQPYNMPLLDEILSRKIRLFDYERIVDNTGRLVKFGPFAGFAGAIDTLHALGLALLMKGFATPFMHIALSKEYPNLEAARQRIREVGDVIRERGLPPEIAPLTIAVTGSGSVSQAAQQILHLLPCKYVDVDDLPRLAENNRDHRSIFVVIVRAKDMVAPREKGVAFSRSAYYEQPESFEPTYHTKVAPFVNVLINGMYWEPRFPRLLSMSQSKALQAAGTFPLLCLGDITCDPGGSVEFFVRSTSIQNPLYAYDIDGGKEIDLAAYEGRGVLILGVDHLPAEFPLESSKDFGAGLLPLIPKVLGSPIQDSLQIQEEKLGSSLFAAMITHNGKLTPNYKYIMDLRKMAEASTETSATTTTATTTKRALVLGAGMVSASCVRQLTAAKFEITVVDISAPALEKMSDKFKGIRTINGNLQSPDVEAAFSNTDVVVSLLPPPMHPEVATLAIKYDVPMVTTSYVGDAMKEIGTIAKKSAIINEIGLDPGIDIMTSAELIKSIHADGGVIETYVSLCGALPEPRLKDCPMGYKFSWSPRGVLTAALRPSTFYSDGFQKTKGSDLYYYEMPVAEEVGMPQGSVWVPNGEVSEYINRFAFGGKSLRRAVRGTLRYGGFGSAILAFEALGWLNPEATLAKLAGGSPAPKTWHELLEAQLKSFSIEKDGIADAFKTFMYTKVHPLRENHASSKEHLALRKMWPTEKMPNFALTDEEKTYSYHVKIFRDLELFSQEPIPVPTSGLFLDALSLHLQSQMAYKKGENDCVIMAHRIVAAYPTGVKKEHISKLQLIGSQECTATARSVGTPAAIAAHLLWKKRSKWTGLIGPEEERIYQNVLPALKDQGILMTHAVRELHPRAHV